MLKSDFASLRQTMVDTQLRTNKVTDERLLAAMAVIPRETFVSPDRAGLAYIDEDISLGDDRWLVEPMVFARLVQAAEITEDDVVLDIACGTGYSAAVLGHLARAVVALESDAAMAETAARNLSTAEHDNVVVETGPLKAGWTDQAPYDVILINGAVEDVPDALLQQLAEGGRLCAVKRRGIATGQAELLMKVDGVVSGRPLFGANTPVLPEFELEEGFTF